MSPPGPAPRSGGGAAPRERGGSAPNSPAPAGRVAAPEAAAQLSRSLGCSPGEDGGPFQDEPSLGQVRWRYSGRGVSLPSW